MKTVAFVFARGSSKGIPRKNILPFAEKPLLAWSIEMALNLPEIDQVYVSTDDASIAEIAREWGAKVIDRPSELALDDSPEWLAWGHAVRYLLETIGDFEKFVSLPTTSPLRNSNDVQTCLDALDGPTDMVVTITDTSRSPWFNMVRIEKDESLQLLLDGNYVRRQDVPEIYDLTTVAYVTRPSFILNHDRIWDGKVRGVKIPPERAIDIDTPLDFKIAEFLMKDRMNGGISSA